MRNPVLTMTLLAATSAVFTAACSDDGPAGTATAPIDAGTPATDASSPDAATTATDASAIDAITAKVVALSANGHDRFYGVAIDAQGRIVVAAQVCPGNAATDDCESAVARFTAAGDLDSTFGTGGVAKVNVTVGGNAELARGIVVTADGKIVIAGVAEQGGAAEARERDVYAARFTEAGLLDTAFGSAGIARVDFAPGKLVGSTFVTDAQWGIAQDAQGRVYVSGSCATGRDDTDFALVRLTANGQRDVTYATNGLLTVDVANRNATPKDVAIDGAGRAVMGGYYTDPTTTVVAPVVFRATTSGALDTTFGAAGVFAQEVLPATAEVYGVHFQGDTIVTSGYGRANTSTEMDFLAMRLSSAGALDTTFGTGGHRLVDFAGGRDAGRTGAVLPNGEILLVGSGRQASGDQDAMVALLTPDGARKATFGTNGVRTKDLGGSGDAVWGVALASGGTRAIVAGVVAGARVGSDAGTPDDDGAILFVDLR